MVKRRESKEGTKRSTCTPLRAHLLRAADFSASFHFHIDNVRRMNGKDSLDALSLNDTPHGKGLSRSASFDRNHNALESLQTFPGTFFYLYADDDGITRTEIR